jgi:thiosulfate/3-mercaptopyruvate sulfurtransferase
VLDGGIDRWIEEGHPTVSGEERHQPRKFMGRPRPDMIVDADAVAQLTRARNGRLVDARAPERYRGDLEPIDAAAGHIPGAADHFFKNNLDGAGRLLGPEDLRRSFSNTLGDTPADRVVCYCGSGVSACHNLLALEHAGLHGAKLYPGSWSEWSSDPRRPVETGNPK